MAFPVEKIRNIAFAGHSGSGKTSLIEAMLHTSGAISRQGSVDEGNTVSDYRKDEIDRKISIATTILNLEWESHRVNLIDTPGFSDFVGEMLSGFKAADAIVATIHGVGGVEVGTDHAYEAAKAQGIGTIFFANSMDRENANFDKIYDQLRETYGTGCVAVNYPVGSGKETFAEVIDIVRMKLHTWKDGSGKSVISDIPAQYKDKADELRQALIESAAEADDELIEKYFDTGELNEEELNRGLRLGILRGKVYPILSGSARKNIGANLLLDMITEFCPSPADAQPVVLEDGTSVKQDVNGKAIAQIFKSANESHVGDISIFRVWSGTVKTGEEYTNSHTGKSEKIAQIFLLNGKNRKVVESVSCGEIAGTIKLKETATGDTLCDSSKVVKVKRVDYPPPVFHLAIECKNKGSEDKLSTGLTMCHFEDPTFLYHQDAELGQTIVSGQGDVHLQIALARLKEKVGVEVETSDPRLPYREAIRGNSEAEGKHKKQSGGRGQFAVAWLRIEPKEREGVALEFVDAIVGGVVSGRFIPAVEKGITEAMAKGVVAGYPMIGVKATLFDGKEHPVDSDETSFRLAGIKGFREAAKKARPTILEPIFDLEVKVPEQFMGDVMGDLSSRRGKIMGMDTVGHTQEIRAKVPQAEIMKYTTTLRSMTGGRGVFRVKFSHYEEVPGDIQKKLEEAFAAKKAGQAEEE